MTGSDISGNPFWLHLVKGELEITVDLDTPGWKERWSGFLERPYRAALIAKVGELAIVMQDGTYARRTFATIPSSHEVKCYGLIAPDGTAIWAIEGQPIICSEQDLAGYAKDLLRGRKLGR